MPKRLLWNSACSAGAISTGPVRPSWRSRSGERTLAHARRRPRLPIRALDTETAQRTFEFGYTRSYPLEILTGERQESHRRTRHHRGRPLPRQQKSNLAERVARAQDLRRFAAVVQDFDRSLFDEV